MTDASVERWTAPGRMTVVGAHEPMVAALPSDRAALFKVARGVIMHEAFAAAYGVTLTDEDRAAVNVRPADQIIDEILRKDPSPLDVKRPPERRAAGNCRTFTVLTVALMRAHGIPARSRCGFGGYFVPGHFEDHWVAEIWHDEPGEWRLADAQIDGPQRQMLNIGFDTANVPRDQFLVAGDAWQRYRRGEADPDTFGLTMIDEFGAWWIAQNLVRDAAALCGTEVLPWDMWGTSMPGPTVVIDDELASLLDHLAALTVDVDAHADELVALMTTDDRVKLPPTVFNVQHQREEPI